jgi:hypothetical protein
VQPFSYKGVKFAQWTLSIGVDGILQLKHHRRLAGRGHAQTLAAASYAAASELRLVRRRPGIDQRRPVDVTNFTLTGVVGYKTDRYFIRNSTLKKEPLAGHAVQPERPGRRRAQRARALPALQQGTIVQPLAELPGPDDDRRRRRRLQGRRPDHAAELLRERHHARHHARPGDADHHPVRRPRVDGNDAITVVYTTLDTTA